jgi:hypothetical protein
MIFLILGIISVIGGLYFASKIIRQVFRRYERGLVIDKLTRKKHYAMALVAAVLISGGLAILFIAPKSFGAI